MNQSMSRKVTEEEIRCFEEDGIVCLRDVLDHDWISRLRTALDAIPGTYTNRSLMWTFDETYRELVFDSPLGELAATMMRSETCGLLFDIAFVKDPRSSHHTPWHQDTPYYQIRGTQLCGTWMSLDPTTLANGGLEWIRGSHKWGRTFEPDLFNGEFNTDLRLGREQIPDIDNHREDYDIVHFDTEPGDVIVDHSLVVHGGGVNSTGQPRRVITHHFFGDDARFQETPPSRGYEDSRDLGLADGDPFPPDHELVPRVWPKRPRSGWPTPRHWHDLAGTVRSPSQVMAAEKLNTD